MAVLGKLDIPVCLKLLTDIGVEVAPFVLLVSNPRLAQPLLVMAASFDVLAVAGTVVPEVVIVEQ